MKLCKDCKHCKYDQCDAPKNLNHIDRVSGGTKRRWSSCSLHLEDGVLTSFMLKTCGKRGRWFEPKDDTK